MHCVFLSYLQNLHRIKRLMHSEAGDSRLEDTGLLPSNFLQANDKGEINLPRAAYFSPIPS